MPCIMYIEAMGKTCRTKLQKQRCQGSYVAIRKAVYTVSTWNCKPRTVDAGNQLS